MKRRIGFSLLLLYAFVLAAYSQPPGFHLRAKAFPLNRDADYPGIQQAVPGVGAGTEDPEKILVEADRAVGRLRNLTYDASYQGVGSFATRGSTSAGKVKLVKLEAGNPLTAKLAAEGVYYPAGKGEPEPFRVAFDGKTISRLRAGEKILVRKTLSGTDPKERDFGFATSLLGAGANQLILFEYTAGEPFRKQARGDVLEYEGRAAVVGVLCHVIYVEYGKRPDGRVRRERWFLGVKDNLPRKVEWVSADDKGRYGAFVLTLSNLRADAPLGDSAFAIHPPKGYKIVPYEQRSRPQLLAVGETAPEWKLSDPAGKTHALSDYRGKVLVLDFWATWCGPCVRTMPDLQALHEKYQGRGVEVFGLNSWEEASANGVAYFKEKGYTYGLLLNGEAVAQSYRVSTLPTVYVIGFSGEVIYRGGVTPGSDLSTVIEQYLKKNGM